MCSCEVIAHGQRKRALTLFVGWMYANQLALVPPAIVDPPIYLVTQFISCLS